MKVRTRSADWEKDTAMDIDHPLYRALSSGRKRANGEMDDYRRSDEMAVRTPPNFSRTPVRLRLSMNRNDVSPNDAEYDDLDPQEDVRKYLSRSNSRKDRSSYEYEEPQEDVRRYLSRSSSRKTRSMPEQEYEYYEDEPRKSFTRYPSKRDRPVFDHEEDGTRRQLSRSSSRKGRPEYEPEEEYPVDLLEYDADVIENGMEDSQLSERRRAMFEPLGPSYRGPRDGSPDSTLPPPDFDISAYPQGWVVGKKRKLVNVDVVESMRRIAVHEMNRKDREIGGLNEQLEEDSKTMEHLQIQLQQERTKRMHVERENNMLNAQINMLMTMINEAPEVEDDEEM
ncbi:uncharacterized protein [Physcomitrium patens]|uniref:Snf1-related kinase interactor 1 n=1 Tax=Physcomitrium patens TaxID=3218 RepID=A3KLL2_PHYPA|nr:uncharacterized protein LOC112277582 [Physcomitrium patens]XP_024365866.1 uncharacterized protein LOC112277582 [Physcomitrium patens]PNR27639.1 hypothetical protein PHYPA_029791 [Physcomitrium patens]CAM57199.1 Snf1-related kinase interactor 1 [Physcomitrium patens]|eukprot:XP_024365865.1 uncharacterized protein LOC112277582 [Physcomitrella patens]